MDLMVIVLISALLLVLGMGMAIGYLAGRDRKD